MDVREEAHPVNRLDVLINCCRVERLTGLGAYVDPDSVVFDALIADDTDALDRRGRGRLRVDKLRREHRRNKQQNDMEQASADAALLERIHQTPFPSLRGATKLTNR